MSPAINPAMNPGMNAVQRLFSLIVPVIAMAALPLTANAQSYTYEAITDFPVINASPIPYYRDTGGSRNVLAINAEVEAYRDAFATATLSFEGESGVYDLTLNTLGELDGDCEYQVSINGTVIDTVINPSVMVDYTPVQHRFSDITVNNGDTIAVSSKAVSNGKIPEGDAFAFARGRWGSLMLDAVEGSTEPQAAADLVVSVSSDLSNEASQNTNAIDAEVGDSTTLTLTVTNASEETVATGVTVNATVPESLTVESVNGCTLDNTTLECAIEELSPGSSASPSLELSFNSESTATLTATVSGDQLDTDTDSNSSTVTFNILAASDVTTTITTEPEDTGPNTNTDTNPETTDTVNPINSEGPTDGDSTDGPTDAPNNNPFDEVDSDTGDAATSAPVDATADNSAITTGSSSGGASGLMALWVLMLLGSCRRTQLHKPS